MHLQDNIKPKVTLGWDGYPTIVLDDGQILPRKAEMIINGKYYKDGDYKNNWPSDPETGEKLEVEEYKC